jgi:competence protein ComEC
MFVATFACSKEDRVPNDGAAATGGNGASGMSGAGRGGATAGGGNGGSQVGSGGATAGSAGALGGSAGLAGANSGVGGIGAGGDDNVGGNGALGGSGDSGGALGGGGATAGGGMTGGAGAGSGGAAGASSAPLTIYWVDVEGGAATLIVTPSREVILVDTGTEGARDLDRIVSVLDEEEVTVIDFLIATHYHSDHVGNVAGVAEQFDIGTFVDHGPSVEAGADADYLAVATTNRLTVAPGDTLPLAELSLTIVSSHAEVLATSLDGGGPNAACEGVEAPAKVPTDENARSVGFVLRRDNFTFLDLGDLLVGNEHELMCPDNRLGQIDLFQVSHHGQSNSNSPQLVHALNPVVAVLNNGPRKGGSAAAFEVVSTAPGLEDIWQLHTALGTDAAHNTEPDLIANPDEGAADAAYYIKAEIDAAGAITIVNARNGVSRTYSSR